MAKSQARKAETGSRQEGAKAGGKLAFIGKVVVFFMTFGFAFPTLFGD